MTEPPRPGSDPTGPYHDPYQAYSDPAYAGGAPYGPGYSSAPMPGIPAPTEPLPQYWTQTTFPHTGSMPPAPDQPPEPPRGPRPWLWALAGFSLAAIIGLVLWWVFAYSAYTNPSAQETSIPAPSESTTTSRTPTTTRTTEPSLLPIPLPTLPIPGGPSTTPGTGETESVTYEVTGSGRAISIAYNDTGGLMQTEFNVPLPWHKDVNLSKPAQDSASIMVINSGKDVTCRITIGGVEIRHQTGAVLTVCSPTG